MMMRTPLCGRRRRCRAAVPLEQWVEVASSLSHKNSSLPLPHQLHGNLNLFDFKEAD
jgi:hypothetical protein